MDEKNSNKTFLNWYRGDGTRGERSEARAGVPGALRSRLEDPALYRPTAEIRDAVNVALMMNLPLLVSGEPGSGKTRLGYSLAHELGFDAPHYFICKSTSEARDLFYTYDAIRHFHSSQINEAQSAASFIDLQALGRAILEALPVEERKAIGIAGAGSDGPKRAVVIVDEIDKAPVDFANDLLFEFENLRFSLPELQYGFTPKVDPDFRPILIITTNEQRALPAAFVRRCASVAIRSPEGEDLREVIQQRFGAFLSVESPLFESVLNLFEFVRRRGSGDYTPSLSELIDLFAAMIAGGINQDAPIWSQRSAVWPYITVFAKSQQVRELIIQSFDEGSMSS